MRVTVFDSGVGGLPILAEFRGAFPQIDYIYMSDRVHLPYGNKTDSEILGLVLSLVTRFETNVIILACNTATAVAASALRARLEIPVFGIEPAAKAALTQTSLPITVLCTPVTARQRRWEDARLEVVADARLAKNIESKLFAGESLDGTAEQISKHCRKDIVLGCTHYSYLRQGLTARGHTVYDGADGLIRFASKALTNKGGGTILFADSEVGLLYRRLFD